MKDERQMVLCKKHKIMSYSSNIINEELIECFYFRKLRLTLIDINSFIVKKKLKLVLKHYFHFKTFMGKKNFFSLEPKCIVKIFEPKEVAALFCLNHKA